MRYLGACTHTHTLMHTYMFHIWLFVSLLLVSLIRQIIVFLFLFLFISPFAIYCCRHICLKLNIKVQAFHHHPFGFKIDLRPSRVFDAKIDRQRWGKVMRKHTTNTRINDPKTINNMCNELRETIHFNIISILNLNNSR